MSDPRQLRGIYRINGQDTMIRLPIPGETRYLISRGSAWSSAVDADVKSRMWWRREFLKRAIIPFVGLVVVLAFLIGFRDLTSVGFWILIGVFAAISIVYAFAFTELPIFSHVPGSIRVGHVGENDEPEILFSDLAPNDRDTLFLELKRSDHSVGDLLQQLRFHYESQRHGSNTGPWRPWR